MSKRLRILMVEDSEDDALFILRELRNAGYDPMSRRVETAAEFTSALASEEWDIITADYSLPQFNGIEALHLLQRSGLDLPFIIVSGAIGEEVAVAAMKSGVHDYILKDKLARLAPAVQRELGDARVRRERRAAQEESLRLAAIVESSGDAIIGKTLDGSITTWNAAAERLFGYKAEEMKGHSMLMLLPPERVNEETAILGKLRRGERVENFESVRVRKDGRRIDVSVSTSPIKDADGRLVGASTIGRDITEHKRAQTCVAALSKLGQNLSSASTPREAAYIIGNIADELFGWDAYVLDMHSPEGDFIRTVLNVDTIDGQRQEVPSTHLGKHPSTIARRVMEQGAELILREEQMAPLPGAVPFGDAARLSASLMFVPIRNQSRVIGVLSVQSYRLRAYERRDLSTLQALADYCGGALERIRVREELRGSETRFRRLSESAPIGIFETDAQGHFTYANPRWTAISGLSTQDSVNDGWRRAIHPEDRADVEQGWLQAVTDGREWAREYRLQTPQGMVRWVRAQAASLSSPDGKLLGYVGTIEDITQSRKAADALRTAQARLQHLVTSSPSVLYALRVQGDTLLPSWVSENIAQLTGYGPEETLSSRWWTEHLYLSSDPQLLHERADGKTVVEEHPFRRKDGTELWIRDEKRLLRNAAGDLVEVVGSWSDITERKLAEEELRNSREQLRALAANLQSVREEERKRIAREIHDELGQSLTGFKMDLAWMRNRLQAEDVTAVREPLVEKMKTMGALLDGMATLMRKLCTELRPGVLDDLGLIPAIEWQVREFESRTGMHCGVTIDIGDLDVDPERSTAVFRIFQEILTNVARHARAKRVELLIKKDDSSLVMEVRDDGRGIKSHEKAGAKSLGLLGMRERALIFGGGVEIDGKSGKGTTVRVKVPLAETNPGAKPTEGGQDDGHQTGTVALKTSN